MLMDNTIPTVIHVVELNEIPREFSLYPKVIRAGCRDDDPYLIERRIEDLQIAFRLRGSEKTAHTTIDGREYSAAFPHVLIKRPGELHRCPEHGTVTSFYFVYDAHAIPSDLIPDECVMFPLEFDEHFQSIFNAVMQLLSEPISFGAADRIDELCAKMLLEILLAWRRESSPPRVVEPQIRRIASYLQMHWRNSPDYEALAKRFGYSLRTFYRHWQVNMGGTPAEYRSNLILFEAKRLLSETEYRIETIASQLGYERPDSFIRSFRKSTGISPKQYRIQLRGR